ncbi:MAG TPA: PAS domain S-box protein, partial [Aggregicoccus sp.]|nr:PAS domain S-box protein [Aggregicoccus sp.]
MTVLPAAPSDPPFEAAFQSSPVGMSLVTLDGALLRVNPAYCAMFGFSERELRGRHFRNRVHPDDRYQAMVAHGELLSGRQGTVRYERRSLHRDGRDLWTEVTATLVRDAAGAPQH